MAFDFCKWELKGRTKIKSIKKHIFVIKITVTFDPIVKFVCPLRFRKLVISLTGNTL